MKKLVEVFQKSMDSSIENKQLEKGGTAHTALLNQLSTMLSFEKEVALADAVSDRYDNISNELRAINNRDHKGMFIKNLKLAREL